MSRITFSTCQKSDTFNQESRIMFFHVWAVRQVEVFIQGWLARFRFASFLLLFKAKVVSLKQKGGGKEFELRSQTPTKQPWSQISQLYFISFGFHLSSFAFYEAAFFQWLLFDHICFNKACHNLRRVFNLSMYITNIIPHGKCFVRCLHTRCFVSEISLVRFAHLFDFWYGTAVALSLWCTLSGRSACIGVLLGALWADHLWLMLLSCTLYWVVWLDGGLWLGGFPSLGS